MLLIIFIRATDQSRQQQNETECNTFGCTRRAKAQLSLAEADRTVCVQILAVNLDLLTHTYLHDLRYNNNFRTVTEVIVICVANCGQTAADLYATIDSPRTFTVY